MESDNHQNEKSRKSLIKVRPMGIDDLAPVFHLGEKLFTYNRSPNLYRTWDQYEVIDFYTGDPEFCLVATMNNEIIGFILATIIDKRQSHRRYGYLVWLGIDDRYRGRGVGTKLFQEFRALMLREGVQMLLVDIEADNREAMDFFNHRGFASPKDHIYLSLNLKR